MSIPTGERSRDYRDEGAGLNPAPEPRIEQRPEYAAAEARQIERIRTAVAAGEISGKTWYLTEAGQIKLEGRSNPIWVQANRGDSNELRK